MNKQEPFNPAWWLPNRHLQTIWPTLHNHGNKHPVQRERIELPDGDFIDLDWANQNTSTNIMVLALHGLNGSSKSPYIQHILQGIDELDWGGVAMNFRGCSGEINRLPHSYNAGDHTDLQFVVNLIQLRYPKHQLVIIGYSLGANLLLKWLGEVTPKHVTAAIAISVPFELEKVSIHLAQDSARFYQRILLSKLKRNAYKKLQRKIPLPVDHKVLRRIKSIHEYDNAIVAPLYGFKNAAEYYTHASCIDYLQAITTPTLIIHALDDPLMTPYVVPAMNKLSPAITMEITEYGGHVGFIAGNIPWQPEYWIVKRSLQFLKQWF